MNYIEEIILLYIKNILNKIVCYKLKKQLYMFKNDIFFTNKKLINLSYKLLVNYIFYYLINLFF